MGRQCVFCSGLYCLGVPGFINRGLFTFFVVFLAKSLAVISQLKNLSDTRHVRADSRVLMVYCNGKWTHVAGTDLMPGDIVSIGFFVCQDTKKEESIPADMLILEGCLIVSESTLTDESVPQLKTFHIKASDTGCKAIVLRTGFKTNQGKLIRTCLFSREKVTAKSWERGLFSLLLVFSAIIAVAHLLKKGLENPNRSTHKLLLSYTLCVTSVIPPDLPITLSLAVHVCFAVKSYWLGK
ncbi:probable manganese-transporting ATPase PDR2 [Tanacetum coccineum]